MLLQCVTHLPPTKTRRNNATQRVALVVANSLAFTALLYALCRIIVERPSTLILPVATLFIAGLQRNASVSTSQAVPKSFASTPTACVSRNAGSAVAPYTRVTASCSSEMTAKCALAPQGKLPGLHNMLTRCSLLRAGVPFLPRQVSQELQDEAQPAQSEVDQGI